MKKHTPQTNPRAAAFLTLLEVEKGSFPEEALEKFCQNLNQKDRSLAAALTYGILRWRSRLDWTMTRFLSRPEKKLKTEVRIILELGLFQLMHLSRIPASAAVNEAVKLAKLFGPPYSAQLVNAVLRGFTRAEKQPDPLDFGLSPGEKLALSQAHPLWLVERWIEELGLEETEALLKANNELPKLTIRVNEGRITRDDLLSRLQAEGLAVHPSAYSPAGLWIDGPTGLVTRLPGYGEGLFTVQDEASQIASYLAQAPSPGRILDACVGLGGKAFSLAGPSAAGIFGLDPSGPRLAKARVEADRLGLAPLHLVRGDLFLNPFAPKSFDVVLVDAPCSNLGVIRRRPDVKWSKDSATPGRMAELQTKMLSAAAALVKPGGRLVYTVCTLTPEETLGVTDKFWMEHLEFGLWPASTFLPEAARPLVSADGMLRAWPHKHGTDGFFAAVFERKVDKPGTI